MFFRNTLLSFNPPLFLLPNSSLYSSNIHKGLHEFEMPLLLVNPLTLEKIAQRVECQLKYLLKNLIKHAQILDGIEGGSSSCKFVAGTVIKTERQTGVVGVVVYNKKGYEKEMNEKRGKNIVKKFINK